jgi:hypothetical protein
VLSEGSTGKEGNTLVDAEEEEEEEEAAPDAPDDEEVDFC